MTELTKAAGLRVFSLVLLHKSVAALNCSAPTPQALFAALQSNVFTQTLIRPVERFSTETNISVSFTLVGILELDETSQTMTAFLWTIIEWDIYGLSWDAEECGASRVSVPRVNLWTPDLYISEFMDEDTSPVTPYVYLNNVGHVFDRKPLRVVSTCQFKLYTFPFDIQNCSLTFGSYLHVEEDIKVVQGSPTNISLAESIDELMNNGEWTLLDIKATPFELQLIDGTYYETRFYIVLQRRPILYVVNLLIPSCFLVTVDLFSFLLPPQSTDRSTFKMTLILGYTVFLLIMNDLLPITGGTTPLINVFFSISLALMVTSLLETLIITNIQFSSRPVPHWLSVFVLHYLAWLACVPTKKSKSNRVTVCINPTADGNLTHKEVSANVHMMAPKTYTATTKNQTTSSDDDNHNPEKPPENPLQPVLEELRKLSRDVHVMRTQLDQHFKETQSSQEWHMIGSVVDRLLFFMYVLFISSSFITIICIWSRNNINSP